MAVKTPFWKYVVVVLALLESVVRLVSGGAYTGPAHWIALALGGTALLIHYRATGCFAPARRFDKVTPRHLVTLVVCVALVWFLASRVFDVYYTALAQSTGGD